MISGNHVHAVQPIEFIKVIRDDGTQKDGLVVYAQVDFFKSIRNLFFSFILKHDCPIGKWNLNTFYIESFLDTFVQITNHQEP